VLFWAGVTHLLCGELASAEDLFRTAVNIGTERGFPKVRAENSIFLGQVLALRGEAQAGLEHLRRATEYDAASSATFTQEVRADFWEYDKARGYELAGKPDEAFASLMRAFEWTEQEGANFELASMHLLRGRLLEGEFHLEEAENFFRTSIDIARRHGAKSLELRATTSLARLLRDRSRRDEARTMLAEIYNWFTEGFDTADLKDAKALLDELTALNTCHFPQELS